MKFDAALQDVVGWVPGMHDGRCLAWRLIRLELGQDLKVAFLNQHVRQPPLNLLGHRGGIRGRVD